MANASLSEWNTRPLPTTSTQVYDSAVSLPFASGMPIHSIFCISGGPKDMGKIRSEFSRDYPRLSGCLMKRCLVIQRASCFPPKMT